MYFIENICKLWELGIEKMPETQGKTSEWIALDEYESKWLIGDKPNKINFWGLIIND